MTKVKNHFISSQTPGPRRQHSESKTLTTAEDQWEPEAPTNLKAGWIQSIEQLFKSKVKPVSSNFQFSKEAALSRKRIGLPRGMIKNAVSG